jgi:hypothetical protein
MPILPQGDICRPHPALFSNFVSGTVCRDCNHTYRQTIATLSAGLVVASAERDFCGCKPGYYAQIVTEEDAELSCVPCETGKFSAHISLAESCTSCPPLQVPNEQRTACNCVAADQEKDANGFCRCVHPDKHIVGGACVCEDYPSQTQIGECQPCKNMTEQSHDSDLDVCLCLNNSYTVDSATGDCVCSGLYFADGAVCQLCPPAQELLCPCPSGYTPELLLPPIEAGVASCRCIGPDQVPLPDTYTAMCECLHGYAELSGGAGCVCLFSEKVDPITGVKGCCRESEVFSGETCQCDVENGSCRSETDPNECVPCIDNIAPVVDCVTDNGDGSFVAQFGYVNPNDHNVTISAGDNNFFSTPSERLATAPPTLFLPGTRVDAVRVPFTTSVTWTIRNPNGDIETATATSQSPSCRTNPSNPYRSCSDVALDYAPARPPSGIYTILGEGGVLLDVYCEFLSSCATERFQASSLRDGGTFRLLNHRSGAVAPPFYGLRADGLYNKRSGQLVTFDFEHAQSDMRMKWRPADRTLRIYGQAYGGIDTGSSYSGARPYEVDFTYHNVQIYDDRLAVGMSSEDRGYIKDLLSNQTVSLVSSAMPGNYFQVAPSHRGETTYFSGFGWLDHSGLAHIAATDWLFRVGDCVSETIAWTRVFAHSTGPSGTKYFNVGDNLASVSVNAHDPTADLYSILNRLSGMSGSLGFDFSLRWPGREPVIWRQTNNPVLGGGPAGYQPIWHPYMTCGNFGGLLRSESTAPSFLDGTPGPAWFYAIGTTRAWDSPTCGIPGPCVCVPKVELYVRPATKPLGDDPVRPPCQCDLATEQCVETLPPQGYVCVPRNNPRSCMDVAAPPLSDGYCAQNDLILLYYFNETSGSTVRDISQFGPALNLKLQGTYAWRPGGGSLGLEISGNANQEGYGFSSDARKVVDACKRSNQFTVEVWAKGRSALQASPARIFTISKGQSCTRDQNLLIGEDRDGRIVTQLRTSSVRKCAHASDPSAEAVFGEHMSASVPTHIVMTWDGTQRRVWINGQPATRADTNRDPGASNLAQVWQSCFNVRIGNEHQLNRQWKGTYYKIAMWKRALTSSEIGTLFSQGPQTISCQSQPENRIGSQSTYWIDPDGADGPQTPVRTECDLLTDDNGMSGWTLVTNQNYGSEGRLFSSMNELESKGFNAHNPAASLYSVLHTLPALRGSDGFIFRLRWPGSGLSDVVWSQSNVPLTSSTSGYIASISAPDVSDLWVGLKRATHPNSLLDGSTRDGTWFYAVATYQPFGSGMPGPSGASAVAHTQLWVRPLSSGSGCRCASGFHCEADPTTNLQSCVPDNAPSSCTQAMKGNCNPISTWLRVDGKFVRTRCECVNSVPRQLLFYHDNSGGQSGFFTQNLQTTGVNTHNPNSKLYSTLHLLNALHADSRSVRYWLEWSPHSSQQSCVSSGQQWQQQSSPWASVVVNYRPISVQHLEHDWRGLASAGASELSQIDGSSTSEAYGVGARRASAQGSSCLMGPGRCVGSIALWASDRLIGSCTPCPPQAPVAVSSEFSSSCQCVSAVSRRSCREILHDDANAQDGYYVIDPDGAGGKPPVATFCTMQPDADGNRGLTRVLYQDASRCAVFARDSSPRWSSLALEHYTPNDGYAFSILSSLEHFDRGNGFFFKLSWPNSGLAAQTWTQRSNPASSFSVSAYKAVNVPHSANGWRGLARTTNATAFADGNSDSSTFYAIGAFSGLPAGAASLPGPDRPVGTVALDVYELDSCDPPCGPTASCVRRNCRQSYCAPDNVAESCAHLVSSSGGHSQLNAWVYEGASTPQQLDCKTADASFGSARLHSVARAENALVVRVCATFDSVVSDIRSVHTAPPSSGLTLPASAVLLEGGVRALAANTERCFSVPATIAAGAGNSAQLDSWISAQSTSLKERHVGHISFAIDLSQSASTPLLNLVSSSANCIAGDVCTIQLNLRATAALTGVTCSVQGSQGWGSRSLGALNALETRALSMSAEIQSTQTQDFSQTLQCTYTHGGSQRSQSFAFTVLVSQLRVDAEDQVKFRGRNPIFVGLNVRPRASAAGQTITDVTITAEVINSSPAPFPFGVALVGSTGPKNIGGNPPQASFVAQFTTTATSKVKEDTLVQFTFSYKLNQVPRQDAEVLRFRTEFKPKGGDDDDDDGNDDDHEDDLHEPHGLHLASLPPRGADLALLMVPDGSSDYELVPAPNVVPGGRSALFTIRAEKRLESVSLSAFASIGTVSAADGTSRLVLFGDRTQIDAGSSAFFVLNVNAPSGFTGSITVTLEVAYTADGMPSTRLHTVTLSVASEDFVLLSNDLTSAAFRDLSLHRFRVVPRTTFSDLIIVNAIASDDAQVTFSLASEGAAQYVLLELRRPPIVDPRLQVLVTFSYRLENGAVLQRTETLRVYDAPKRNEATDSASAWSAARIGAALGAAAGALLLAAAVVVLAARRCRPKPVTKTVTEQELSRTSNKSDHDENAAQPEGQRA